MDTSVIMENKPLFFGAVGIIAVFVLGRSMSQKNEPPVQRATIVPPQGVTWEDIASRRNVGVMGVIGPGEPVRGDSAYEIAVKQGFVGNLPQWLESLKGTKGDPGAKGEPGTVTPVPPTPTVPPPVSSGWQPKGYPREIDPTGKPYYCPDGYYLGMESTGSGHHVCIANPPGTREIRVIYKAAGGEAFVNTNPGGRIGSFIPVPAPFRSRPNITVKRGDTLHSLAARGYGSPGWWELLVSRNPGKAVPVIGEKWNL